MHAVALTKRLREHDPTTRVTVNACHPGVVNTNLMRHTPAFWGPINKLISPFLWFFFKTDNDGAQTALYLALSKKVDGISGKYFRWVCLFVHYLYKLCCEFFPSCSFR